MKTSKYNLIAILMIGAAMLTATNASAGGFSFGGGGGNKGSFKISFHSNHNHKNHKHVHHGHHHHLGHHHHVRYYAPPVRILYNQCYHPQFQCCYVYPGDNWYSISKQMYGVKFLSKHIAAYNGLSMHSRLVPGQILRLPVVNANGSLAVSKAPMPAPFAP